MNKILFFTIILSALFVKAQVPEAGNLVTIHSATLAEINAIASPYEGSLVYNTDDDSLYQFIVNYTNTNRMIRKTLAKAFAPSGIAIHPITKEVFLLSSPGKLLVVLDENGKIKDAQKLSPKYMKQPEGICFDRDGTLYITSEGDGGKARLLKYEYYSD